MDRQCPGCQLPVAIGDPEARKVGETEVWHSGCLKKKMRDIMPYGGKALRPAKTNARVRVARQLPFDFGHRPGQKLTIQ